MMHYKAVVACLMHCHNICREEINKPQKTVGTVRYWAEIRNGHFLNGKQDCCHQTWYEEIENWLML
jgi:hypothetical protein